MLRSISLLRGLSALGVVLYHTIYFAGRTLDLTPHAAEPFAGRLSVGGVTTFFCLSGYLMARLVEGESFGRFASRRLLRIYPAFFVATVIAVMADRIGLQVLPDFPLAALTLLPVGVIERPLGVEWTLVYEIFYYAVASLFCFGGIRRFFPVFIVMWTIVVLTAFLGFGQYGTQFQPTLAQIVFSVWNLGFLIGALGRYAERLGWARPSWALVGLLLIGVSEAWGIALRGILLPAGLGLVMISAIVWETRRGGMSPPRWAIWLGDASYGIYLLHITVIRSVMVQVGHEADISVGVLSVLSIGLVLLITVPFGLWEHHFYGSLVRLVSAHFGSSRSDHEKTVARSSGAAR
jgi:peptidoglycan/LPS O-acetylase OafA/YrhL